MTQIGLLHITPKTHPSFIKKLRTTLLNLVPGATSIFFPAVKLAEIGFGHTLSALAP